MKLSKTVMIFCIASVILIMAVKSQTNKPPTPTTTRSSTDSTISLKDLSIFNQWLRDNASVTQYSKLTPEGTLQALWDWKLQQIKQLADTTKKK